MTDVMIWVLLIYCTLGVTILGILFITILRAIMKLMDRVDEIDSALTIFDHRKVDRPVPPPNVVPLERM